MLYLCGGQSLGERVGNHVVGREIHEAQRALFNNPPDPTITHVYMLDGVMILVSRERNGGLVVGERGDGLVDGTKDPGEEAPQPEGLLHPVHGQSTHSLDTSQIL